MTDDVVQQKFARNGYVKLVKFFKPSELNSVKQLVERFHQAWCKDNAEFYASKAVNSSGLTSGQYLTEDQLLILFKLICHKQILKIVKRIIPMPLFMGTQLFFDPFNPDQANYWHRDPQYHLSLDEQKLALSGPEVLHLRIPLYTDPGIEVIPGSHKNWDSEEERQIRLEQNGHKNSENLSRGIKIPSEMGDLAIFSANMIHRGLYGKNRLALDILYCERVPELIKFIQIHHQPTAKMFTDLDKALFL